MRVEIIPFVVPVIPLLREQGVWGWERAATAAGRQDAGEAEVVCVPFFYEHSARLRRGMHIKSRANKTLIPFVSRHTGRSSVDAYYATAVGNEVLESGDLRRGEERAGAV